MPNAPLVSVIMPVYNAEKFLAQAVESILRQTYTKFELILVDDASRDQSPAILQMYAARDGRIKVLRHERNQMISQALNTGLAAARGKYIARMDADDIALADRLRQQVDYMEANPEIGVSGGAMQIVDEQGRLIGERRYHLEDRKIRRHLFRYSPFSHPTIMLRKDILDQAGYYRPEFDFAEDYELYFRLGRIAKFGNLPGVLLKYRVVSKSITTRVTQAMELKTLAIRRLAEKEYGYRMSVFDRIYWLLEYVSVFTVPAGMKNRFFSWARNWLVRGNAAS